MTCPASAGATNTLIVSGRAGRWAMARIRKSTTGRALVEQVQGGQGGQREVGVL